MKRANRSQVMAIMAPYNKQRQTYREKQIIRLVGILNNIFKYEPDLKGQWEDIDYEHLVSYFDRIRKQTYKTQKEKYVLLRHFFCYAQKEVRIPVPQDKSVLNDHFQ